MTKKNWDPLLSRKEAAHLLGVKVTTLEVWASTRRYNLPFVKVGRLVKYRLSDLQAFVEEHMRSVSNEVSLAAQPPGQTAAKSSNENF